MAEPWVPSLHLSEKADRCRLTLSGLAHGDGYTLQQAADDLIARLLDMALYLRSAGYPVHQLRRLITDSFLDRHCGRSGRSVRVRLDGAG
jgi:hypothetical protein